jgi:DNA-directed RNA polymerase subunit L
MITPVATGLQDIRILILHQLPGATETAVSFQIEKEDHTLGNALRYFINKKSAFQPVCPHGTD